MMNGLFYFLNFVSLQKIKGANKLILSCTLKKEIFLIGLMVLAS